MANYCMGVFFNAERVNTDEEYKKRLKRCKKDYISLADLVIAVNWMNWHWYKEKNYELADFYGKLYYQAVDTVYEIIKDNEEALSYFYGEIN